jgi:hypothetical protein
MNTTWFRVHRVFTVALLISLLHFIITSAVNHYIAMKVGSQVGQVVAGELIEASENREASDDEANRIYGKMKSRGQGIIERWKIPLILISLPIKPLMNPFLKKIRETRMHMVLTKEISREQFYTRGIIIDYTANFINSVVLGSIIYVTFRMLKKRQVET